MRTRAAAPDPASVLFGRSMRAVLGALFGHPERAFYLREIARIARTSPSSLQRELAALAAAGLIVREEKGRQVYFRANAASPLFEELRGIVVKTFGVADVLRRALAPIAPRVRAAFIYGSIARGEARPESDVDVMLIGEVDFADVVEQLQPAEAVLGRAVNPTVYPPVEFSGKAADAFLAGVLREPKIFLIGEERELGEVAEGRTTQAPKPRAGRDRGSRRARR
ncbi:MAG TPA: nucleotidyltransferase domain-containing protein [Burkholderiales bacterium]|nr:nucleotidyltransferase domain-containing protein [Burkholderiales bacterium]